MLLGREKKKRHLYFRLHVLSENKGGRKISMKMPEATLQ